MDIAAKLRDTYTRWNNPPSPELPEGAEVLLVAADEIERLNADLKKWRGIAETRQEAAVINHAAYEKLRAEIEGRAQS